MPSLWTILCYIFDPHKFIYRLKLIRWLFKSLVNALQGCEEDPLPKDWFERFCWYKKRFYAFLLLYRLMMDVYDKAKEKKERSFLSHVVRWKNQRLFISYLVL